MLLGRERELRELEQLLERARQGRSGVLALTGETGIGKSALLDALAARADGMNVLRARGVQSESNIPFAGLFELLRPALGCLDRIPLPQAAALESALALRPARADDRFAVGAATLSLLAAHADERPLAVLVDDVHWLDGSSADALVFAARRLVADPIAMVVTVRDGERSAIDGLGLETLHVGGLEPEVAAELVRREAPGVGVDALARLQRETGGNPLALLELAHERLPELPLDVPLPVVTSVAKAYLQRAGALPGRTPVALTLAAATDRGDLALFARAAAGLGLATGDLTPAEQAGLVAIRDGRLEFRHPLARSAIYADAAPETRRAVHRALADALPDSDADRRAWHLALAAVGPDETASSALEQAAVRAHERSAYDVASLAFARAARLTSEPDRRGFLLCEAADAAWLGGLADRTAALLDDAAEPAAGLEPALRVEHLRGRLALRRGPLEVGRALLVAAADRAASAEPALAVRMLAEAAQGAFYAGDAAGMRDCAERATAARRRGGRRPLGVLRGDHRGDGARLRGGGGARRRGDPLRRRGARALGGARRRARAARVGGPRAALPA